MTETLVAYISTTFFLVITPGVTTAVVVRHAIGDGRRAGIAAALGAALGNGSQALLAGLGVTVLLRQWPAALTGLQIAGGLYLCWLGVRLLYRAWRGPGTLPDSQAGQANTPPALRDAWMVTILNPSSATFYLAVVPSFLTPGSGASTFVLLAAIHITMALASHLAWVTATASLSQTFASPRARRTMDAVSGVALLALGVMTWG